MSWDVLGASPVGMLITLILLWIIGAATIVISSLLRGIEVSLCHGVLGLTGIILWLIQISSGPGGPMSMSTIGVSGLGIAVIFQFLFLLGMIVTTNIRLRMAPHLTIRIMQGICSGGFLIFSFVLFINFIRNYSQTYRFVRSETVGDFIFIMLLYLVSMASAILAVVHAVAIRIQKNTLSQTSLGLIAGVIACTVVYIITRLPMIVDQPVLILCLLNLVLLTVPIVFLFCSGLIGLICGLAATTGSVAAKTSDSPRTVAATRAAAAPPGGDAGVHERLKNLDDLKNQGLITNEEYAVKRAKVLEQL